MAKVLEKRADVIRATTYCLNKLADDMEKHEHELDAALTQMERYGVHYDVSTRVSFDTLEMTHAGGVKFKSYVNHKWWWHVEIQRGITFTMQRFDSVAQIIEHIKKEVLT